MLYIFKILHFFPSCFAVTVAHNSVFLISFMENVENLRPTSFESSMKSQGHKKIYVQFRYIKIDKKFDRFHKSL
jgi:hypothetical protein